MNQKKLYWFIEVSYKKFVDQKKLILICGSEKIIVSYKNYRIKKNYIDLLNQKELYWFIESKE